MTVKELIAVLRTKPPHLQVAYRCYSEACLLDADQLVIKPLCEPRPDGWIQDARPDKPTQDYLVFPGN